MSTWLPGTCGLPSAWRSKVRTIWMRTKAVNISTAAGASEISANDRTVCAFSKILPRLSSSPTPRAGGDVEPSPAAGSGAAGRGALTENVGPASAFADPGRARSAAGAAPVASAEAMSTQATRAGFGMRSVFMARLPPGGRTSRSTGPARPVPARAGCRVAGRSDGAPPGRSARRAMREALEAPRRRSGRDRRPAGDRRSAWARGWCGRPRATGRPRVAAGSDARPG